MVVHNSAKIAVRVRFPLQSISVGALTLKSKAFNLRTWERVRYLFIDCFNIFGSYFILELNLSSFQLLRVLPQLRITDNWLLDKTRVGLSIFFIKTVRYVLFLKQSEEYSFASYEVLTILDGLNLYKRLVRFSSLYWNSATISLERSQSLSGRVGTLLDFLSLSSCVSFIRSFDGIISLNLGFKDINLFNGYFYDINKMQLIVLFFCNIRLEAPQYFLTMMKNSSERLVFSLGLQNQMRNIWSIGNKIGDIKSVLDSKHIFTRMLQKQGNFNIIRGSLIRELTEFVNFEKLYELFAFRIKQLNIGVSVSEMFQDKTQYLGSMVGLSSKVFKKSEGVDWNLLKKNSQNFFFIKFKTQDLKLTNYLNWFFRKKFNLYFNTPAKGFKKGIIVNFWESSFFEIKANKVDLFFPISNIFKTGGIFLNVLNGWQVQQSKYTVQNLRTFKISLNALNFIMRNSMLVTNKFKIIKKAGLLNLYFKASRFLFQINEGLHFTFSKELSRKVYTKLFSLNFVSFSFMYSFSYKFKVAFMEFNLTKNVFFVKNFIGTKIVSINYDNESSKKTSTLILLFLSDLVRLRSIYNIGFFFRKIFLGEGFFYYEECAFNFLTFRQRFFARIGVYDRFAVFFCILWGFINLVLVTIYLVARLIFDTIGPVIVKLTWRFYFIYKYAISFLFFLFFLI